MSWDALATDSLVVGTFGNSFEDDEVRCDQKVAMVLRFMALGLTTAVDGAALATARTMGWSCGACTSIYASLSPILTPSSPPQAGVHLLMVSLGLNTTPCIVMACFIAYRRYYLSLPQSYVPSQTSYGSFPLGGTSRPHTMTDTGSWVQRPASWTSS